MAVKLGVAWMDLGHAAFEQLLAGVHATANAELASFFETVVKEIEAHFAREEKALMDAGIQTLLAHIELHQQILTEVERTNGKTAARDIN